MNIESLLDDFWRRLAVSNQPVLLLDYDGTLAPFRVERNLAVPYAGVREQLAAIRTETTTRLVIISGRSVDDLVPLLGLNPPPEIWGCHGWERLLASGERPALELPAAALAGLREAACWIKAQGLGERSESKPASLAVHWRGLPESEARALEKAVCNGWEAIAKSAGLELHLFNGGLELRCPGRDKGTAVTSILTTVAKNEAVAFLGDDLTDEDGFAALAGRGLAVLVRSEPRETRAVLRLTPPAGLLEFLETWHARAPGQESITEKELR